MADRRTEQVAEGIYRRDGRLLVRIWDPVAKKRTQHYPDENTVRAAKTLKRELELRKTRRRGRAEETVGQFASRWLRDYGHGRGESTRKHNAERIGAFKRDFKDRRLSEVSRQEARAWVVGGVVPPDVEDLARGWHGAQETAEGVRVPSHKGNHAVVRAMYTDALGDQIDGLTQNPFANMQLQQSRGRRDIVVITQKELERLVEIAGELFGPDYGPVFGAMIEVAAWTCMRPGEIFALRWSDIDFERDEIRVSRQYNSRLGRIARNGKNREPRTIVLTPGAKLALQRIPRQIDDDTIFFTSRGVKYTSRVHHYYWDKVRRTFIAQLPEEHHLRQRLAADPRDDFDFYELRHFGATWLLELGLQPSDVAIQMGHQDGGKLVMEVYGHPSETAARDRIRQAALQAAARAAPAEERRRAAG